MPYRAALSAQTSNGPLAPEHTTSTQSSIMDMKGL